MIANLMTTVTTAARNRPRYSVAVATVLGGISLVALNYAARQPSLPWLVGLALAGVLSGGAAVLAAGEAAFGWINPPPGPLDLASPADRKRVGRAGVGGLLLLLAGAVVAGVGLFTTVAIVIGIGVALAAVGIVLINIWMSKSVVTAPLVWTLAGLLAMVAGGALVEWRSITAGIGLWLLGLTLFKVGLLPGLDAVTAHDGRFRDEGAVRRRRALGVSIASGVGAILSVGPALAGLHRQDDRLILLAVLLGTTSLSGLGLALIRVKGNDSWPMAATLWLLGLGLGCVGAYLLYRAAGDWVLLTVVVSVVLLVVGAWFVFRGEGFVALVLVASVMIWVVHDRNADPPAVADGSRPVVVALGDSFMSGEGARTFRPGTNTTDSDGNQCRRSPTAYAELVARQADAQLVNVSCSGAVIANLSTDGQYREQTAAQPSGRDPQLATVAGLDQTVRDQVKVALVSIGGNDTGFGKIVQACLLPTNCADQQELWIAKAESLEGPLAAAYQDIQRALPNATIVVVPYPRYVAPVDCGVAVSGAEYVFVDEFIDALDGTILRAARSAGVLVADTIDSFDGHQQCDAEPGANVVALAPTASPIPARLRPASWTHNSMHPNEVGHRLQADKLAPLVTALIAGGDPSGHVVDLDRTPDPVTPEDRRDALVAEAEVQLTNGWLADQLTDTAATLLWPLALLITGGLLLALGCCSAGRPRLLLPAPPAPRGALREQRRFAVIGLASDADGAHALVVAPSGEEPPAEVVLMATGCAGQQAQLGPWRRFDGGVDTFWWRKASLPLPRSARATVTVRAADPTSGWEESAPARLAALPLAGSTSLRLVVGSCFDRTNTAARLGLVDAYERAYESASAELAGDADTLHMWLGDQVYLDAPWTQGLRDTDGYEVVAGKYLDNWEIGQGRQPDVGFGALVRRSSNWFLPDDHEFWNGYPELSYFTLTWHALRRASMQLWRFTRGVGKPHPANQGPFGTAAGNGFMVFQTSLDRPDGPDEARGWIFDETTSPPQVQRIELDRLLVVIVDTRWHRTIRRFLPGSGFMHDKDLDAVVAALRDETHTRPVVLMTGRPMLGFPPRRSWLGVDVGAETYTKQAERLWRAVWERAESGRATVIVGGDVHRHGLSSALDNRIVEVVSSPLALLNGGEGGSLAGRLVLALRSTIASTLRRRPVTGGFPVFDQGRMEVRPGEQLYLAGAEASGIACLAFDLGDDGHPAFRYSFAGVDRGTKVAETWDLRWTGQQWSHTRGPAGDR